jgi:cytosine/uracil/thiamine/allantoin permease
MALHRRRVDREGREDTGEDRAAVRLAALVAWLAGTALGLSCTASPLFTGPLARGLLAQSSIGYFLGFLLSASLYVSAELATARLARRTGRLPVALETRE